MCVVVNKHYQEYDIYIGRGSKWGNPYSHKDGTKALYRVKTVGDAIKAYKNHLWNQIRNGFITLDDLRGLHGKRLGCYCAPRACHGDVLKAAVEWAMQYKSNVVY